VRRQAPRITPASTTNTRSATPTATSGEELSLGSSSASATVSWPPLLTVPSERPASESVTPSASGRVVWTLAVTVSPGGTETVVVASTVPSPRRRAVYVPAWEPTFSTGTVASTRPLVSSAVTSAGSPRSNTGASVPITNVEKPGVSASK
jgi:hypothetical protein